METRTFGPFLCFKEEINKSVSNHAFRLCPRAETTAFGRLLRERPPQSVELRCANTAVYQALAASLVPPLAL